VAAPPIPRQLRGVSGGAPDLVLANRARPRAASAGPSPSAGAQV
jgi:hypothetical protein